MGAAAEHRGNAAIRRRLEDEDNETVPVTRRYLSELCSQQTRYEAALEDEKEKAATANNKLRRAKHLIDRLRAENAVLKSERRHFTDIVQEAKRHPLIANDFHSKYAVTLVSAKLKNARLI